MARMLRNKKGSAVITLEGADATSLIQRKATIVSTATGWQPTSGGQNGSRGPIRQRLAVLERMGVATAAPDGEKR